MTASNTTTAELHADCSRCFGLCCVAPAFAKSADFAINKPAGRACINLEPTFGCGIHSTLRAQGFSGCTTYDCFGAGQRVSQVTFGGYDWRQAPATAPSMFDAFAVMRQLHELLWYLHEADTFAAAALRKEIRVARERTDELADQPPMLLAAVDIGAHRDGVNDLLREVSELVRSALAGPKVDHRGADLIGARLDGADLRAASLRGAYLIGAHLRGADLRGADLIGADLRSADLRGANLTGSLFLIQSQLDTAQGDQQTRLPDALRRPSHWPTT